mmetsp:Transcript_41232/g.96508  ORF Transcript_41232/g.96508 Transcript_41232/m.96508 type:complete len:221 (+) Transcript_41232:1341-2003(+)
MSWRTRGRSRAWASRSRSAVASQPVSFASVSAKATSSGRGPSGRAGGSERAWRGAAWALRAAVRVRVASRAAGRFSNRDVGVFTRAAYGPRRAVRPSPAQCLPAHNASVPGAPATGRRVRPSGRAGCARPAPRPPGSDARPRPRPRGPAARGCAPAGGSMRHVAGCSSVSTPPRPASRPAAPRRSAGPGRPNRAARCPAASSGRTGSAASSSAPAAASGC